MKNISNQNNERNAYIDFVKAVAIILVIVGHCIQYGSGNDVLSASTFFDDKVFKFIYSFHMPLFMLVSGYLYSFSMRNVNSFSDVKRILLKKISN